MCIPFFKFGISGSADTSYPIMPGTRIGMGKNENGKK